MTFRISSNTCPLCGRIIVSAFPTEGRDIYMYLCELCGRVHITDQAISALKPDDKHLLSGVTRDLFDRKQKPVDILSGNIETLTSQADIPRTIPEKIDRIITYLAQRSESLGHGHRFEPTKDYPIAYCKNENEFRYLLEHLKSQGLATFPTDWVPVLTPKAWDRIESLRRHAVKSTQAFVAMWFKPELERIYTEGIEKAIRQSGYLPLRVDKLEHNGKICDAIVAEIRRSAFLVADFTGHRGGVYFEVGFAMGLGIPVIWLCREGEIGAAHFDTRQYNHILWKDEKDLFEKLYNRINATIVPGKWGNGN